MLEVLTWGYNRTTPPPADLAINVRWIPNPFHIPEFHDLTGLDVPVQEWVFAQPCVTTWFDGLRVVLRGMLDGTELRGGRLVTAAIGCQGGHDRSVAIARRLAEAFERDGTRTHIKHLNFVRGPR